MSLRDLIEREYELVVDDRFDGDGPDPSLWIPHHLPQWSSRAASAARFEQLDHALRLRVERSQPPWCPEFDGEVRVSSLQTGVFAGPVGSANGQHRFSRRCTVREAQATRWLHTPHHGVFTLRAAAHVDRDSMAALWMIGIEDEPKRSGVVDVVEIFGKDTGPDRASLAMGVKAFGDPDLVDHQGRADVHIDVTELHEYAICWTEHDVTWFVDDVEVHRVDQSPSYPMQFMLGVYSFVDPTDLPDDAEVFEPAFTLDRFCSYRPRL